MTVCTLEEEQQNTLLKSFEMTAQRKSPPKEDKKLFTSANQSPLIRKTGFILAELEDAIMRLQNKTGSRKDRVTKEMINYIENTAKETARALQPIVEN